MEDRMNGLQSLSNDLALAVERAGRAVFAVNGRARLGSTGVHWRPGLVVTADHTVHVDEEVTITGPDGRALTARVAGRDPTIDVAVLKVDAPGVAVADVADSDAVRVGHIVLALGAGPRASWGVVSSMGEGRMFHLDLTLYPGFSGGPLVDPQGRVVGINTSGASRHWQLAIPAAAVNRVVDELQRRGRIPRAYLGVSTQPVRLPEPVRQRLNLDQQTAVIVVEVQSGSPAAAAGLTIGDVIVSLGATRITDPTDLKSTLRPDRVGESITASVLRGGEPRDLQLTVGERPRRS
ncbi:MAG: LuxR family transcriptional regulator [Candidatus Rokuibacteriota bacterium]|nr:MAG: LuxR family transcriptional regulator [Candidatus Rokubacteria bacterium]